MNRVVSISVGILVIVGVGGLVIVGVGGLVYLQTSAARHAAWQNTDGTASDTGSGSQGQQSQTITAAQIVGHNGRASCWSSINGNVYDLTSWIPQHPGGEQAILQLCGTDGSAKFNGQHGGSPRQAAILAGFKIGSLAK